MTLIMPNTPFYRDDTYACDGIVDPIIIIDGVEYQFMIPFMESTTREYGLMIKNNENEYVLKLATIDRYGNNALYHFEQEEDDEGRQTYAVLVDGEIIYVSLGFCSWKLYLISGVYDEYDVSDIEIIEDLGCIVFYDSTTKLCNQFIKIEYDLLDCKPNTNDGVSIFTYYLKGRLSMQPAISDENVSFLGTNGQTNTLFSIVHQPLMLTTSVMGWREHQFLTNILNSKNVKINGQSMNRVDGSFYTVRDASTKGKIGTMLFILATTIFTSCCKEYEPEPTNYIVEDIVLEPNTISITMANEYETNDTGAWIGSDGSGIKFYWGDSYVELTPSNIQDISTDGGSFWILSGSDLAETIRDLVQSDPSLLKPQIAWIGNTLNITIPDGIDNLGITFNNGARISPLLSEYFTYETFANNGIFTNGSDRRTLEAYFGDYQLTFFINKNGNWENVTYQVFNNTWKVLNSTDVITKYQIRKSDGITVLVEGDVSTF